MSDKLQAEQNASALTPIADMRAESISVAQGQSRQFSDPLGMSGFAQLCARTVETGWNRILCTTRA